MRVILKLAAAACAVAAMFGASSASAATVYYYTDPSVVASGGGSETANMRADIVALGHTVIDFSGDTMATWGPVLAAANLIIIPEQEVQPLTNYTDAAVESAIQAYVTGGKSIQFVGAGGNATGVTMNTLFGYSLAAGGALGGGETLNLNAAAAGTPFAGGAATLPGNNGSFSVTTASLPVGGRCIYDRGADCFVLMTTYGSGRVMYTAWDYFLPAADGGWNAFQDTLINALSVPVATVPTLTEWAMILFGLVLAGFAVLTLQRRRFEA